MGGAAPSDHTVSLLPLIRQETARDQVKKAPGNIRKADMSTFDNSWWRRGYLLLATRAN